MSFDYDQIHAKRQSHESFWASYADLYLMLATIFLMMFVIASLHTGTQGLQQKVAYERLAMEAEDLREQTRVYNTLKDDYLEKDASADEQKTYKELMKKLSLLQDNTRKEKDALRRKAAENEKKEFALNKYQQIIRNIINANMLAKAGLKSRDEIIETKKETIKKEQQLIAMREQEIMEKAQQIAQQDSTIAAQNDEIEAKESELSATKNALTAKDAQVDDLQKAVARRQQVIDTNEEKIRGLNSDLAQKIAALKGAADSQKMSEEKANEEISQLQAAADAKINNLKGQNAAAGDALEKTKQALDGALKEKAGLKADAAAKQKALSKQIADLGDNLKDAEGKLQTAQGENAGLKADNDAKGKQLADLGNDLADTQGKLDDTNGKLKKAQDEGKKYKDYIGQLQKEKAGLNDDLENAKKQLDAKKKAAKRIKDALAKAGVDADVDPKSGDVVISFGDEYFDTGKSDLKPGMRSILSKTMPAYSASLFKDKKFAEKIQSVEIVGFASPTYKGRYVDPKSLSDEDRAAVTYNLDLSYNRAKAIFNYVFDQRKMRFHHQKEMLPLVKVSGRSYLHEGIAGRTVESGLSVDEYCQQYDCMKDQKVVIKFNLKDN